MTTQSEDYPASESSQEQINQHLSQPHQKRRPWKRPWVLKKRYMVPIFTAGILLFVAAMFSVADSTGIEEPIPLPIDNTMSTEPAGNTPNQTP